MFSLSRSVCVCVCVGVYTSLSLSFYLCVFARVLGYLFLVYSRDNGVSERDVYTGSSVVRVCVFVRWRA